MRTRSKVRALAGRLALAALVAPLLGWEAPAAAQQDSPLRLVATIDLPGPGGQRFDYLVIDPDDGWLFSAHLGASQTYVLDLAKDSVVKTVPDTPGAEGLEYVPEGRKVYTSNAFDNTVGVVDLATLAVTKKIPTEAKPDGSTYARPFHKLYVADERAKAVAVIDTNDDRVLTTLHFPSETGVPTFDAKAGLVYVNLQDQNMLAAIDPRTDAVVGSYPVTGCEGNHGMALDVDHRRAFIACQANDTLAVFDLDAHRTLTTLPLPRGSDVVQFDAGRGRVYVACAIGAIAVIQADDPDHYRKLADFKVQRNVHSLAVDPKTHRVYAPEQEENGRPVARMLVFEAND